MKYRPDLDGLRAVAIAPVVLFHAFPEIVTGGFIGVDIFFVISGFLITQIISDELSENQFSLYRFYARRIRRIFPALILSFVAVAIMGWTFLFPHEFVQLGRHILASAGFYENFLLLKEVSYFDRAAETKPLLHIWSLAVEEQYYLGWPLLLIFARKTRINLFLLAASIWLLSYSYNLIITASGAEKAFFLPWTRTWELMSGALIAVAPSSFVSKITRYRHVLSLAGAVLLALGFLLINKSRAFPGFWASFPTIGASLLILAGSTSWINKRLLAQPFLVFIGKISYPLYLWHWPLFSYLYILEGKDSALELRIAVIVASLIAAIASTFWIEKPIRLNSRGLWPTWSLIAVFLTIVALGFAIKSQTLLPRKSSEETLRVATAVTDFEFPKGLRITPDAPAGVYETVGNSGGTTLILGDSHAMQYSSRIVASTRSAPETRHRTIFATYSSCPPIPDVFTGWDERSDRPLWANSKACEDIKSYAYDLLRKGTVDVLVVSGIWNGYFAGIDSGTSRIKGYYAMRNGKRHSLEDSEGVTAAMENLKEFLRSIAETMHVILVLDNPDGQDFDPTADVRSLRKPWVTVIERPSHVEIDLRSQKIASRMRDMLQGTNVEIFDPSASYCSDGMCRTHDDKGRPIYRDINHLTSTFVREEMVSIDSWISTPKTSRP